MQLVIPTQLCYQCLEGHWYYNWSSPRSSTAYVLRDTSSATCYSCTALLLMSRKTSIVQLGSTNHYSFVFIQY